MGTDEISTVRLANLRDVGGMTTDAGQVIRPGVLYRSDMPRVGDALPVGDFTWPPPTVVDLRSAVERGSSPHPLSLLGSEVHIMPLLGEETGRASDSVGPDALAGGLRSLYTAILDIAAPRLVEIVDLAAEAPGPLLVHCAAGKDRTGIVVALLLRLAGVGREQVIADYLATGANMPGVLRRLRGQSLLPGARTASRAVSEVSREAVEQVLAIIDADPDGPQAWLLDRGASPDSIAHWRKRIVD
ncbi:Tyrosine phosphatase family protein [Frankia sp. EI5c]|uniref:tyrosine-protein phosphatase n=1 Tax=Frankia sp. EI5c TaxID=683316 RepID=UPI0007C206B1|nr:tyrosine-protein phosphatase [Frankia sp. EI5c]OAA25388.1 Tyrosine phosphatase family protein [Frankia sp. EI5c]